MEPEVKDCSEMYRRGMKMDDFYFLNMNNQTTRAFCHEGWTDVLQVSEYSMIDHYNFKEGFFAKDSYALNSERHYFMGLNNLLR